MGPTFAPHRACHVRRKTQSRTQKYALLNMSGRHTNLFIPSHARPQPANLSPVPYQPPPPPEVKPRKPSDEYRGTNGFKVPRYVPEDERQSWDQDRDDLAMWALDNLGEAPPSYVQYAVCPIL